MAASTRSKSQAEVALELEAMNDRVTRSESSHLEIGSKVSLVENQIGVLAQQ